MAASGLSRAPLTGAARVAAIIDQHARNVANGVRPEPSKAAPPRRSTNADLKRELLEIARSLGWRGKTVHSAQKFVQALERAERARRCRPDPAPALPSSPGAPS